MNFDLNDRRTRLGAVLIALGLLALLSSSGMFDGLSRIVGMLLFGAAGVLVIGMYRRNPARLWTLPVGFGLLGLAVATLELPWSGGAFLGAIGLGFLSIWLLDTERKRWWALIPTGVLLTLGVVAAWDEMVGVSGDTGGTIFFLGLAATFAALYLLPSVQQRWAIWPALALGVVAVLTLSFSGGWIAPIVLIGLGAWLLTRQSRPSDVRTVDPTSEAGSGSTVAPLSPMPVPTSVPTPTEADSAGTDVVRDETGRAVAAAGGEEDATSVHEAAADTASDEAAEDGARTHDASTDPAGTDDAAQDEPATDDDEERRG